MAVIKQLTFESGTATGADAYDSTIGSKAIDSTTPILGTHSIRFTQAGASGRVDFTAADATSFAFWIRVDAAPTSGDIARIYTGGSVLLPVSIDSSFKLKIGTTGTDHPPLEVGKTYRIEVQYKNNTGSAARQYVGLAEGNGTVTTIVDGLPSSPGFQPSRINTGLLTGYTLDEIHIRDDTTIPTLPALPSAPATELAAAALLELTTTATLQQVHTFTTAALLELTSTGTIEQPAELEATALLELVVSGTISQSAATVLQAETLLELTSSATIEQVHALTAAALLELTATAAIEVEEANLFTAESLVELVTEATIEQVHELTSATYLELIGTAATIQQDHNLRAAALLELFAHDGYVGPGTGLVIGAAADPLDSLREGDTFNVFLPWAGLTGVSGLAHVMSRTVTDDRDSQELELQIVAQPDPALVPQQSGGATPTPQADSTDLARQVSTQKRVTDRIDRNRKP